MIQLPSMSFRLIEAERARQPVSLLRAVLGVTRAGYHAWRERRPSPRERADEKLQAPIRRIFSDSQESYGAPRVQAALADDYGPQGRQNAGAFRFEALDLHRRTALPNPANCAHGEV